MGRDMLEKEVLQPLILKLPPSLFGDGSADLDGGKSGGDEIAPLKRSYESYNRRLPGEEGGGDNEEPESKKAKASVPAPKPKAKPAKREAILQRRDPGMVSIFDLMAKH